MNAETKTGSFFYSQHSFSKCISFFRLSSSSFRVHAASTLTIIFRSPFQDYRAPAFYMVTITTHERRPLFAVCENNASTLTPEGWLVYKHWQRITEDYPKIAVSTLCIMPDHLHGILRVTERMEEPFGVAIRAFKSQCTSALRKQYANPAFTLWSPGYNDRCVWRRGTLPAFTRYIMDNPRRYCLKKEHPDLFRKVVNMSHPVIPSDPFQ